MPAGIFKRERCTTSSPPASACSDPTCAWGQKQRFVLLLSILHKCKALCGTCAAGIAAPKALHESKGPFSFAKENGPFGIPRERLRLAVLGSKGLLPPECNCLRGGIADAHRHWFCYTIWSTSIIRCRSRILFWCGVIACYRKCAYRGKRQQCCLGRQKQICTNPK